MEEVNWKQGLTLLCMQLTQKPTVLKGFLNFAYQLVANFTVQPQSYPQANIVFSSEPFQVLQLLLDGLSISIFHGVLCVSLETTEAEFVYLTSHVEVNSVLGFCTGVHHRQKGKGGKRQEEPVRRVEGEAGASPGQSPFTKSHFG